MNSRSLKTILIVVLISFLSLSFVFANNVDDNALEIFLEKLSQVSDNTRKYLVDILRNYFNDGEEGIDNLINDLDIFISEEYIDFLEEEGYTLEDVKDELNKLKDWDNEDRMLLLDYIESNNTSGIKSLIEKYTFDNEETNPADNNVVVDEPDETKVEEPNEENVENLLEVNFKDIENHPYEEDIIYLAERGIIEGRTEEIYDPDGMLTRAEFVTLIHRVLKLEEKEDTYLPFKDVSEDSWYYEYVKSAFDNQIVEGTSPTTFSPDRYVTREEMATIIVRILKNEGILYSIEPSEKNVTMYEDYNNISSWAKNYLFYAVRYGLLQGRTETELAPREYALRGEAANSIRSLYNALKDYEK